MSDVLPEGTELAGYRIERLAGRGGMGVVYVAEHVHLGRTVALKTMSSEYGRDSAFRERFVRESRVAAAIDHPHIVPIYDAGEADGVLYLAMRFVEGEDLDELIEREAPLDPEQSLALLDQVADALDAAHAEGLVHRDVKPGNVLLDGGRSRDGVPHCYLSDFGLTKHSAATTTLTAAGQVIGTLAYVAPEQIEGGDVDGRADQYSLACVLYECLTGRPPFGGEEVALAVIAAHLTQPPPLVHEAHPDLPRALSDVITKAMAKDREQRYPSCLAFIDAARAAVISKGQAFQQEGFPPAGPRAQQPTRPAAPATPPPRGEPTRPGVSLTGSAGAAAETAGEDGTPSEPAPVAASTPSEPTRITQPSPPPVQPPGAGGARARSGVPPWLLAAGVVVLVLVVGGAVLLALRSDGAPEPPQALPAAPDAADEPVDGDQAAAEGGGDGIEVPEIPDVEIPDIELGDPGGEEGGGLPPTGQVLYVSNRDGNNEIYVSNPDGSDQRNLTQHPADDRQPGWSPDRSRVVFASNRDGVFAIYTMAVDGSDVQQVTSGHGTGDFDPVWGPDGQRIAFSAQIEGTRSIWVINPDGTEPIRLSFDDGIDARPTWSPDAQMIAYHSEQDGDLDIWVTDGTDTYNLTQHPGADFHPAWSPDGRLILFTSERDGQRDLYVIDVVAVQGGADPTSVTRNITQTQLDQYDADWSPDGSWIVYESLREGQPEIYLIRPDGSDLRRLTDSLAAESDPAW